MTSLQTAADELLASVSQMGLEQSPEVREAGLPQFRFSDYFRFHELYDQFLWEVVTASSEDLVQFARLLFDMPYIDLPVALQVPVFRLAGLEGANESEIVKMAEYGIKMYCIPSEEKVVMAGIRGRHGLKDQGGAPQTD